MDGFLRSPPLCGRDQMCCTTYLSVGYSLFKTNFLSDFRGPTFPDRVMGALFVSALIVTQTVLFLCKDCCTPALFILQLPGPRPPPRPPPPTPFRFFFDRFFF